MSEDYMDVRGRHADYETAELEPIDRTPVPVTGDLIAFTGDDVDLSSDPFADDLSEELAARAPRRYATRTTAVLAGLVLVGGGFFAGAQVQKNYGTPAAGSTGTGAGGLAGGNFAGGNFAGRQGGAGAAGAAGAGAAGAAGAGAAGAGATAGGTAAAGVTTGTVKLVDGTTVYVQTADGNVVTVKTSGSTAVQIAQNGALTDLAPGAQVTVEGPAASDGTVTASKVIKGK
jgi:hypothetical protein